MNGLKKYSTATTSAKNRKPDISAQLKELHIGEMIRAIAEKKQVSSKKIAEALGRCQKNYDKIFRIQNMDVDDIVQISYLLGNNMLEVISEKYLSHLPFIEDKSKQAVLQISMDIRTNHLSIHRKETNCDFLKNINAGAYLKDLARQNN